MLVFLNKAQGLLKNKSELFNVLHAPIYKITSSSILKIFQKLKNCQLYCAHYKLNKMNFQHIRNSSQYHQCGSFWPGACLNVVYLTALPSLPLSRGGDIPMYKKVQ
jgi:hypothetical protein